MQSSEYDLQMAKKVDVSIEDISKGTKKEYGTIDIIKDTGTKETYASGQDVTTTAKIMESDYVNVPKNEQGMAELYANKRAAIIDTKPGAKMLSEGTHLVQKPAGKYIDANERVMSIEEGKAQARAEYKVNPNKVVELPEGMFGENRLTPSYTKLPEEMLAPKNLPISDEAMMKQSLVSKEDVLHGKMPEVKEPADLGITQLNVGDKVLIAKESKASLQTRVDMDALNDMYSAHSKSAMLRILEEDEYMYQAPPKVDTRMFPSSSISDNIQAGSVSLNSLSIQSNPQKSLSTISIGQSDFMNTKGILDTSSKQDLLAFQNNNLISGTKQDIRSIQDISQAQDLRQDIMTKQDIATRFSTAVTYAKNPAAPTFNIPVAPIIPPPPSSQGSFNTGNAASSPVFKTKLSFKLKKPKRQTIADPLARGITYFEGKKIREPIITRELQEKSFVGVPTRALQKKPTFAYGRPFMSFKNRRKVK
jgi:hypothetical protein